jgi:hypothetical protein
MRCVYDTDRLLRVVQVEKCRFYVLKLKIVKISVYKLTTVIC